MRKLLIVLCFAFLGCVASQTANVPPIKQRDIVPIYNPIQPVIKPCSMLSTLNIKIEGRKATMKFLYTVAQQGENFSVHIKPVGVLTSDGKPVGNDINYESTVLVDKWGSFLSIESSALADQEKAEFLDKIKNQGNVFSKAPVKTGSNICYSNELKSFFVVKGMGYYDGRQVIVSEIRGEKVVNGKNTKITGYSYIDAELFQQLYSYVLGVADGEIVEAETIQTIL